MVVPDISSWAGVDDAVGDGVTESVVGMMNKTVKIGTIEIGQHLLLCNDAG